LQCASSTPNIENIIFIGTGTTEAFDGYYTKSIDIYKKIFQLLPSRLKQKSFYRPHPNEFYSTQNTAYLSKHLKNLQIDRSSKSDRLCGPKTIVIGSYSSFLFEAWYCNHLTAHIDFGFNSNYSWTFHAHFSPNEHSQLARWVENAEANNTPFTSTSIKPQFSFLEAFNVVINL
jgi:hypothetical protein